MQFRGSWPGLRHCSPRQTVPGRRTIGQADHRAAPGNFLTDWSSTRYSARAAAGPRMLCRPAGQIPARCRPANPPAVANHVRTGGVCFLFNCNVVNIAHRYIPDLFSGNFDQYDIDGGIQSRICHCPALKFAPDRRSTLFVVNGNNCIFWEFKYFPSCNTPGFPGIYGRPDTQSHHRATVNDKQYACTQDQEDNQILSHGAFVLVYETNKPRTSRVQVSGLKQYKSMTGDHARYDPRQLFKQREIREHSMPVPPLLYHQPVQKLQSIGQSTQHLGIGR